MRTRRSKYTNVVTAATNGVVTSDTTKLAACSRMSAPKDVSSMNDAVGARNSSVATVVTTPTKM